MFNMDMENRKCPPTVEQGMRQRFFGYDIESMIIGLLYRPYSCTYPTSACGEESRVSSSNVELYKIELCKIECLYRVNNPWPYVTINDQQSYRESAAKSFSSSIALIIDLLLWRSFYKGFLLCPIDRCVRRLWCRRMTIIPHSPSPPIHPFTNLHTLGYLLQLLHG